MPITWTDFEACIQDRIAHYQKQYDQATRIYQKLLKQDSPEKELLDLLNFQQAMADEVSRQHRLLRKYAPAPRVRIEDKKIVRIEAVRLN